MVARSPSQRGSWQDRGYDREYFKARNRYIRDHKWCEMCLRKGVWERARHVDHNHTIKDRPDLRLEPTNFVSLCESHHDLLTRAYDMGDIRGACDDNGMPLDPRHPWAQASPEAAMQAVNAPITKQDPPPGLTAALKRRAVRGK